MSVAGFAEALVETFSKAVVERLVQQIKNSDCQGAK